jgi:glycosyltransferase involved in cell wall biosynthesis
VDVVLGCWATPDGVAAIELARRLGAASVVKVHGTDLNVLARRPAIRRVLERALPRADRLVAVNRPLADVARELGVPERKLAVVRNGLDRETFRPRDRGAARAELGLPAGGRWIVYVGLFHRMKGLAELAAAFDLLAPRRPDVNLALVGEGPDAALAREAQARHPGRVVLTGPLPAAGVARWMAAADLVTLPSWAEGTPNVILEAFAAGRRVVATRVGGIPDLVRSEVFGALVPPRDPAALAAALEREVSVEADPQALAQVVPSGWDESASRLLEVLQEAVAERAAAGVMAPA